VQVDNIEWLIKQLTKLQDRKWLSVRGRNCAAHLAKELTRRREEAMNIQLFADESPPSND
jgi:hypothetical protein